MTVSGTPGTGAITLGSAVSGYQTFAAAGIANGQYSSYGITDGTNWEVGQGYYTSSGTTWTRSTILASSNSGSAISCTSNAIVYLTVLPSDMQSNVLISGGTIDGTVIGGTTPAAGTFSVITSTNAGPNPCTAWMGDISGARWLTAMGNFSLSFLNDNSTGAITTGGSGNITYNSETFYPKMILTQAGELILGPGFYVGTGGGTIASNAGVGLNALGSNTTGSSNSALGVDALWVNTTGTYNTAVGAYTLFANTTSSYNTAVGSGVMAANTTGSANTAVGQAALTANTSGPYNTAVGQGALQYNTTGAASTAVGQAALLYNVTGGYNAAVGCAALADVGGLTTAGSFVVGASYTIVSVGTTSFTSIGASANTVGTTFTATGVGSGTGTATPNVNYNTAVGYNTGRGIITGSNNTIIGAQVTGLAANLTGTIILATGDGTIQADYNKTVSGKWTLPTANGGAITPAITTYTSGSGTYTVPTGCAYLKIRMVGAGGGGGGSTAGSAGGTTSFGTSSYSCAGGSGGSVYTTSALGTSTGGAGGSAPSGTVGYLAMAGQAGATGFTTSVSGAVFGLCGGRGGDTLLGIGGIGGSESVAPTAGIGYGSGGGGYTTYNGSAAGGGGSGAYQEILITSPASSYAYSVGSGGAAGTNGAAGAGGCIIIEAH